MIEFMETLRSVAYTVMAVAVAALVVVIVAHTIRGVLSGE